MDTATVEHVAEGFCEDCLAESSDQTPGDVSTTNGFGRKFYGAATPCVTCGSVVRTLWWTAIDIPLVPRGSYRYKTVEDDEIRMSRFWARRTRTRWGQVFKTWLLGLLIGAVVITAVVIYQARKSG